MVTTLIFDWGGVLTVGTHTSSVIRILENEYNIQNIFAFVDPLMVKLDAGSIDFKDFCDTFNQEYNVSSSEDQMKLVFEKAIQPNDEMVSIVRKLKETYRLIFLSNNNVPTIKILREKYQDFLGLFEKVYFSAELKIRKPNKEIFEHVIKDAKLNPEYCLFIDDKEKNIVGAGKVGINGILFESIESFRTALKSYSISV